MDQEKKSSTSKEDPTSSVDEEEEENQATPRAESFATESTTDEQGTLLAILDNDDRIENNEFYSSEGSNSSTYKCDLCNITFTNIEECTKHLVKGCYPVECSAGEVEVQPASNSNINVISRPDTSAGSSTSTTTENVSSTLKKHKSVPNLTFSTSEQNLKTVEPNGSSVVEEGTTDPERYICGTRGQELVGSCDWKLHTKLHPLYQDEFHCDEEMPSSPEVSPPSSTCEPFKFTIESATIQQNVPSTSQENATTSRALVSVEQISALPDEESSSDEELSSAVEDTANTETHICVECGAGFKRLSDWRLHVELHKVHCGNAADSDDQDYSDESHSDDMTIAVSPPESLSSFDVLLSARGHSVSIQESLPSTSKENLRSLEFPSTSRVSTATCRGFPFQRSLSPMSEGNLTQAGQAFSSNKITARFEGFPCDICRIRFTSYDNWRQHRFIHFPRDERHDERREDAIRANPNPSNLPTSSQQNQSNIGQRVLSLPDSFVELICHECGQTFRTYDTFRQHTIRNHRYAEFTCNLCRGKFWGINNIEGHQLLVHNLEPPSRYGPSTSTSQLDQSLHNAQVTINDLTQRIIENFHRPDPNLFICVLCGRNFRCREAVDQHRLLEH